MAYSPRIEGALQAVFSAATPDAAFVTNLERQLLARGAVLTKPRAAGESPLRRWWARWVQPLGQRRWATIALGLLLAVAVALAAVGPQRVWAEVQRLLGYVPGVGFVDLEETRVLTAPVEVTRDGVTLRLEQVLAQPGGTTVVIHTEGLPPEDQLWPHGATVDDDFDPGLRLPDARRRPLKGCTLRLETSTLEFPPLPDDVYRVTLELPRLPLAPAGTALAAWEVPLILRPATGELVGELFPQPYAPSDARDTHEDVTLRVLEVAHSPDETALRLQVQWPDPDWLFPHIGHHQLLTLRDDLGHVYQRPAGPSSGSSSQTVIVGVQPDGEAMPSPTPTIPTHERTSSFAPVSLSARRLTLVVDEVGFDVQAEASFTVDLGDDPQVGDHWPLDIDLDVAGFPVHISGARLVEERLRLRDGPMQRTLLQFDVDPVPEQAGRTLQPWLLGGLAVLAGIAAWGVRRLDVGPAHLGWTALAGAPYAVAVLLLLAHLLTAADMVGFGLRAGGYPLNRWGVWGYAAVALLAAVVFLRPGSRTASGLTRLALPLLVTLALMQAHFLTDLVGAEYATYRDYEQPIVLAANLGVALALCLAGMLYRRPRWLRGVASVHVALVLGLMGGSSLLYALRDGFALWQVYRVVLPPSPLLYLIILYTLGLLGARPARKQVYWGALAVLLGVFVAGETLLFVHDLTWMHSSRPPFFDWLTNLMLVPLLLALGILSGVYLWRRQRLALRSPLTATLLLLWVAALWTPRLLGPGGLPESDAAMPWVSADYHVPAGAWTVLLPVARVLAGAAPWLTLLVVALQIGRWMSGARRSFGPLPAESRRRLVWLAVGYSGLLVVAVGLEMWSLLQIDVPLAMVWDSRQPVALWGLVSLASVGLLTSALRRRSGPGRWGGWLYGLVLTVQFPAWLLGLGQLEPVFGLFNALALIGDLTAPPAWRLILPWLSTLALGALVWQLGMAARALRQLGGRGRI